MYGIVGTTCGGMYSSSENAMTEQSKISQAADCDHLELIPIRARDFRSDRMQNRQSPKRTCLLKLKLGLNNECDHQGCERTCKDFKEAA